HGARGDRNARRDAGAREGARRPRSRRARRGDQGARPEGLQAGALEGHRARQGEPDPRGGSHRTARDVRAVRHALRRRRRCVARRVAQPEGRPLFQEGGSGAPRLRRDRARPRRHGSRAAGAAEGHVREGRRRAQRREPCDEGRRRMNRPSNVIRPRISLQQQAVVGEKGGEAYTRAVGRNFIMSLYGSLRSIRMYPPENPVVQKGLEELIAVTEDLRDAEGDLELRVSGEFIFVNSTRLRLDLDNYTTFSYLLALCRACGVGVVRVKSKPTSKDWTVFLSFLLSPKGEGAEARFEELQRRLDNTGVLAFEESPPVQSEDDQKV